MSGLRYPIDALAEVASTFIGRIVLIVLAIPFGISVGLFSANGLEFFSHWTMAFQILVFAGIIWIVKPSFLIVNVLTLAVLVVVLSTESSSTLWWALIILVSAWALLAYSLC